MATKYLFIDGLYRPWLQFRSLSGSSLQLKARPRARLVSRIIGVLLFLALLTQPLAAQPPTQIDIQRPPGSTRFGRVMTILSNGNIVVAGTIPGGRYGLDAIYLYNGVTGALISTLTEGPFDTYALGSGGVIELSNGNYLVVSLPWQWLVGAVTWGNGVTGVSGVVDSTNSLVGGRVGSGGVIVLSNGNYVVSSPEWWDNGLPTGTGAVTWGNGATGTSGKISSANSLVGSNEFSSDGVGSGGVKALSNGNYVVSSPNWYGEACCMGAVTWGNGATGTSGVVSSTNSLVGSKLADQVGGGGVTTLSNGNYVVSSPSWSNGMGAVTWGNGATGSSGVVNSTNSLVGSTADDPEYIATGDQVGGHGVITLSNGNYVVASPQWHNGGAANAGAVTWANGATGISGVVNSTNSLVGSTLNDQVGSVIELSNGHYVVVSPGWDNGPATDAGAVTWGNSMMGVSGVVNSTNSLVGSTPEDFVGGVTPLSNGNYVVVVPSWDNGVVKDIGAVTWGNGMIGISGVITDSNSLVGSTVGDFVGGENIGGYGNGGVTALLDGNYVVVSPSWDNGIIIDTGAVTWGNGASGVSGQINNSNSVLGATVYGGRELNFAYDAIRLQLVVGRPYDNIVTLFRSLPNTFPYKIFLSLVRK